MRRNERVIMGQFSKMRQLNISNLNPPIQSCQTFKNSFYIGAEKSIETAFEKRISDQAWMSFKLFPRSVWISLARHAIFRELTRNFKHYIFLFSLFSWYSSHFSVLKQSNERLKMYLCVFRHEKAEIFEKYEGEVVKKPLKFLVFSKFPRVPTSKESSPLARAGP